MRSPGAPRISKSTNTFVPGSWEPGRFHLTDAITLKIVLIFMAANRAFDYFTPTFVSPSTVTEVMQTAFPMWAWGCMILLPLFCLIIGLAARIHFMVWLGHGLLAVVYLALIVSLGLVYIDRPLFDGSRSATALLAPLVLHGMICVRTGWKPPSWPEEEKGAY